jgi:hypothetical protein
MRINGKPKLRLVRPDAAPLRAAIYCRKSTGDAEKDPELKSTTTQETNARAWAAEKGLKVVHVFTDEDESGNKVSRPDFNRLLGSLGINIYEDPAKRGHELDAESRPFDVVICRDVERVTRNDEYGPLQLSALIKWASVELHCYKDREIWTKENYDSLRTFIKVWAGGRQRKSASTDVREKMAVLAKQGKHMGGAIYGYTVKQIMTSDTGVEKRSHSTLVIHKGEAAVVRGIFKMFCAGFGARALSKTLNGDRAYRAHLRKFFDGRRPPKPIVGNRVSRGTWAPTAIRDMLRRERYIGQLTFGRIRNTYDTAGNLSRVREKQRDKIVCTTVPKWRIVDDDLWQAAQRRIEQLKKAYVRDMDGRLPWGRPESGRNSKYLLSGLMRCSLCNASIIVHSVSHGRNRKTVPCYVCCERNSKGAMGCANNTRAPVEDMNQHVLAYLDRMLTPKVIERAVKMAQARAKLELRKDPGVRKKLERDLAGLKAKKQNLLAVQAHLDDPADVAEQINELNQQIKAADKTLSNLSDGQESKASLEKQAQLLEAASRYRELMQERGNVALARQVLRKALREQPIKCTPVVRNGRKTFAVEMPALWVSASSKNYPLRKVPSGEAMRPDHSAAATTLTIQNVRCAGTAKPASRV